MAERVVNLAWPEAIATAYKDDPEALNDLAIAYQNCSTIRDLVAGVLTKEVDRVRMATESESFLDKVNPDHRRDWYAGRLAGIRYALTLLTMTEVKNDRRR